MLSKEDFIYAVNEIKSINDRIQKVNELNKELALAILNYSLQDTLIDVLAKSMNLPTNKYYGNTISWWIYENDFGKKHLEIYENKKIFPVNTVEELYDLCVREGKQNA